MKLPKELREKKALIGAAGKKKQCSVIDCGEIAIRSLSENKWSKYAEKASLKIIENRQHKLFLCKKHYKEINKIRKTQEKLYVKKGFLDNSSPLSGKRKRFD
ncbi:MAG: hypothetical protein ACTSRI_01465 [Promethearchaeota archaeon]